MRSRTAHLACILLLLSSLAVSDARACSVTSTRTPGGVFVRNLLLQAAVDEPESATSSFGHERNFFTADVQHVQCTTRPAFGAAAQTAHVHAVTGNSL